MISFEMSQEQQMTEFYNRIGMLPLHAEKSIISLFRKRMMCDITLEEVQQICKKMTNTNVEMEEKQNEVIETGEFDDLLKLCISPAEKFMDEFTMATAKT